jgi:hypothetical protein
VTAQDRPDPIPVKEGIVLDREGNPLTGDPASAPGGAEYQQIRMWRPGPIALILFAFVAAGLFFAGIAVAAVIVAAMLIAAVLRVILRALGLIR